MNFNDLLCKAKISPSDVLVFRHRPKEPRLRRVLPWLAGAKPELYNAFQRSQGPAAEAAMLKAKYIASFVGTDTGKAVFVGLYKRENWRSIRREEFLAIPENQALIELGMEGFNDDWETTIWFELVRMDFYHEWAGRLQIDWPGGERSWWRWAERNTFKINCISSDSLFEPAMPAWDELCLSIAELRNLPQRWRDTLTQWRGIYLIFDASEKKGYVGSAYGAENLLGRWLSYVATGHGGNKELKNLSPANFLFTILQRVSPDMDTTDVIRLEGTWKQRLHTREFGLNRN